MKSPLAVDKALVKELGIEPEFEISPIKKLAFLEAQYGELENMVWRSRVDVIHANRLINSDVEALQQKGHTNLTTHKNEVKQFYGGMKMIKQMINELKEEYPELKPEP